MPRRHGASITPGVASVAGGPRRGTSDRSALRRLGIAIVVVAASAALVPKVAAQDQVRNFGDPILVLDTGGHHAPVRSLIFTPDEKRLLSAGEDKVVRVWDLSADPPGLDWTIRPPIFRGAAGAIFAMALSPPDPQGRQRLALGGFGIRGNRGDIGMYRFPGAADRRRGDVLAVFADGGHANVVQCLAFDPSGRRLASGSSDGTVRLWEDAGGRPAVLAVAGQAGVNGLAFVPDARWRATGGREGVLRLATGGIDGTLRIWDVARRALVAQAPPRAFVADDPDGVTINALGASPDGRWVVIGREDGKLIRYDLAAADLDAGAKLLNPGRPRGAVEALAFAPDGRLATSILSGRLARGSDRPIVACDVEILAMPDGAVAERVLPAAGVPFNRGLALAFSPRGTYLAIGGGDDQGVVLKSLRDPLRGPVSLSGRGSSLWDVGFVEPAPGAGGVPDVAFSYVPPSPAPPATYWGFGLKDRAPTSFAADRVRRAIADGFDGWTLRPVSPRLLEVHRAGLKRFEVRLSDREGRWWSHTFLPPGPGHDRGAVAVACKYGVVVHRLEDGVRTRFLDGHSGSVYCLAPSPDGKWLATGSEDQTVRLWALAGCDGLAPLGAEFDRRDGSVVVKGITPRGFAEASGLEVGDVIESFHLGGRPVTAEAFLAEHASAAPNTRIEFAVRRKAAAPPDAKGEGADRRLVVGTSKRDAPLLSLFVGKDREWVLWMPRGYYDSSVSGDSTYLGWHLNRATIGEPAASDYFPLRTYERELRQPRRAGDNLLDRLLASADERVAFAGPAARPPDLGADQPPIVSPIAGRGASGIRDGDGKPIAPGAALPDRIVMDEGTLDVDWKVAPWQGRKPGPFGVRADAETVLEIKEPALDPAGGASTVASRVALGPGRHKIQARGENDKGVAREQYLDVEVVAKPGRTETPTARLLLLTIAPEFDDPLIHEIKFGRTDADDLSRFFARHLVRDASCAPFPVADRREEAVVGRGATAERIMGALAAAVDGPARRGDLVVVVIESHVLNYGSEAMIAASTSRGFPPKDMVSAEAVAAALGTLARRGCKVVVLVDGVHIPPGQGWDFDLDEWARTLRNREMVTTFLASKRRPGAIYEDRRVFTKAVLDSIAAGGPRPQPGAAPTFLTLAQFRKVVLDGVEGLSSRRQEAACFLPDGIDARFPFLNPRAAKR